jgi:hypothetical protein
MIEVEKTYNLKTRIPVYIGYFTAWVDREGQIHFMKISTDMTTACLLLSYKKTYSVIGAIQNANLIGVLL